MKDGHLDLERMPVTDVIRTQRPIKFVVTGKPDGSPGRGEPEGYNLQAKMYISDDDYKRVYVSLFTPSTRLTHADNQAYRRMPRLLLIARPVSTSHGPPLSSPTGEPSIIA